MDSIGLGNFLENILVVFLLIITIILFLIVFVKKEYFKSIIFLSVGLNIISLLFFWGDSGWINYFNFLAWPIINIFLIICYVQRKK
jgi:hypothetical protein